MRRRTGLNADKTRRQLLEECQDVATPESAAYDHLPLRVDAVDLKNRLCNVETDDLESAEFAVVINLLLTRVPGETRQHYLLYQLPCLFFRGFLEFRYHREIRGHAQKTRKIWGFCPQSSAEKQALSRILTFMVNSGYNRGTPRFFALEFSSLSVKRAQK